MKKNFKLFSIMLGCLAVMALSSCLSDNDDNSDKEKEWNEWYQGFLTEVAASHGNYAGYIYYQPNQKEVKQDSVAGEWAIVNDSILELHAVPTRLFVEKLPENQSALKEAVSAVGTVEMRVKIYYYSYYKSPLLFFVYPEPVKLNVTVEGQEKTVVVNFHDYETDNQSFGQFMMSDGQCLVKVFPKSIVVDKETIKFFTSSDYAFLIWYGKKR